MSQLQLHELPLSPNNIKVRIALGYKKLPYERHPLQLDQYPGDRSEIVKISGQPLTPVLLHGDRVIFDSGSILRYLEGNFRDTPPLFSHDLKTMRAIEEWEWTARTKLGECVGAIFREALAEEKNLDACRKASALMHEFTGPIEARLAESSFLVGDQLTAADCSAAPGIRYAMLPDAAATDPVSRFFCENLQLGDGRDRTRAWVQKVLAYDEAT